MAALALSADTIDGRFFAHMKADLLARTIGRRHQFPDRIENDAKLGVVLLFQILQLSRKVGVSG